MTPEPLDEVYFKWLYRQVAPLRLKNPARTYWSLLRQLFEREFVWFIPNDDNRAMDGVELRCEFLAHEKLEVDDRATQEWLALGCSMLEMLIALSRRLSFVGGGASSDRFWQMLHNVGLDIYNDLAWDGDQVEPVIRRINERTYDENGNGGLFPLMETDINQQKVELFYQMNSYVMERG